MVIFRSEGLLNGRPFRNELAIVFEFEAGRIRSFREYVGMPLKLREPIIDIKRVYIGSQTPFGSGFQYMFQTYTLNKRFRPCQYAL